MAGQGDRIGAGRFRRLLRHRRGVASIMVHRPAASHRHQAGAANGIAADERVSAAGGGGGAGGDLGGVGWFRAEAQRRGGFHSRSSLQSRSWAGGSYPIRRHSGLLRRFASRNDGDVMAINFHLSMSVHPGPWLKRNVIDHFALSVTDAADHLGVSRQSMSKLLNGRQGLSAEMAIGFEKAFGLKADTLLQMQSAHELAEARAYEDEIEVERVGAWIVSNFG